MNWLRRFMVCKLGCQIGIVIGGEIFGAIVIFGI